MNHSYLLKLVVLFLIAAVSLLNRTQAEQPLKVFVLCGQSNMQGHAHVRTLPHIGMDPATAPLLELIQQSDGTPKVFPKALISYLSSGGVKSGPLTTGFGADENKIGPELTFGVHVQEKLGEPILIIKTAWGGKSIHTDFRPPSAGPYGFSEAQKERIAKQEKSFDEENSDQEKGRQESFNEEDFCQEVLIVFIVLFSCAVMH